MRLRASRFIDRRAKSVQLSQAMVAGTTTYTMQVPDNFVLSTLTVQNILPGGIGPTRTSFSGNAGAPFSVFFFQNLGSSCTMQLQIVDGGFTKCHGITLTISGGILTVTQRYSKYNPSGIGFNFDTGGTAAAAGAYPIAGFGITIPYTVTRSGVLDAISVSAAAAFSTRLLRGGYTGSALRVRRSSDNTEQDIGFAFSSVDGWTLDTASLTAFVGVSSGFVVTWYDQSGNAINATQATQSLQPRIVNAGVVDTLNGRASPNGVGQHVLVGSAPMANTTELSVFTALKPTSFISASSSGLTPFALSSVDAARVQAYTPWSDGSLYFDVGAPSGTNRISGPSDLTAGSAFIASFQNSTAQSRQIARINGTQKAGDTSAHNATVNTLNIFGKSGTDESPRGPVAEFLFFSQNLTDAQIQTIERDQGAFYGISVA